MEKLRHSTKLHKAICHLLIMTVLISGFMSIHVHVHHHENPATGLHSHDIDMHANAGVSHHDNHTQILDITTPGMNKKFSQDTLSLALMLLLVIILPVSNYRFLSLPQFTNNHFWQYCFHLTPQLRAPPL